MLKLIALNDRFSLFYDEQLERYKIDFDHDMSMTFDKGGDPMAIAESLYKMFTSPDLGR